MDRFAFEDHLPTEHPNQSLWEKLNLITSAQPERLNIAFEYDPKIVAVHRSGFDPRGPHFILKFDAKVSNPSRIELTIADTFISYLGVDIHLGDHPVTLGCEGSGWKLTVTPTKALQ
ncbi:MAG: hypothetical protein GC129_07210 [Proteobacteria bacterium]|nr:hypothetical protein [Pseudomonadota bacterium]